MSCGRTCTSPPPAVSVLSPSSFSQVRSATSWVLPSCGDATALPFEVGGAVDRRVDDEERTARGRAGHDLHALVELGPGGDGRAGPDVAGVERSGLDGLDAFGAGVERVQLQVHVLAERLLDQALLDADDGRRVGDVGEVAEPERHRDRSASWLRSPGRRRRTASPARRRRRWRAAWWWCGACALRESPPERNERNG